MWFITNLEVYIYIFIYSIISVVLHFVDLCILIALTYFFCIHVIAVVIYPVIGIS